MAVDPVPLTKSRFAAGLQCPKRLWLELRAPELATPGDPIMPARLAAGSAIGRLAHGCFPGGIEVGREPDGFGAAVRRTRELLADPAVPAVFEGAFEHEGLRVRCDVLARDRAAGGLVLVEVKSGTHLRAHHEVDAALQLHVVEGAGVPVRAVRIMHLDRGFVRTAAPLDAARLFTTVDLTARARARAVQIARYGDALRAVAAADAVPAVATGPHCTVPRRCPFHAHCHGAPPLHPIGELPRLGRELRARLEALGIADVRDIPDDLDGLSPPQQRVRDVVRRGVPFVDPAVRDELAGIALPACFVDFETANPAIPLHPGTAPYTALPVQWSAHVLAADGGVTHHEYLYEGGDDPRPVFAERLLAAISDAAALVTYSGFEAEALGALATAVPARAAELHALRARVVDLLEIVRRHCYHPAFHGSFSIKTVLPVLVPGRGYDDLAIRDGLAAMAAYDELGDPAVDPARRAALRADLLAYCRRDTEAMLALYRTLWTAP